MKKKLLAILMAVTMVFSMFAYAPLSFAEETTDSYGEYAYSVLQYIDQNLIERRSGTDQEKKMADYLKAQLESFGYEVEVQPFSYTRRDVTYNSQNIIVTKKGESSKEVIVGSHYDSVGTHGVDDNGSGTVVNLETAKRFVNKKTPYTIKFVFFGAEEAGLRGSKAYSDAMTDEEVANTVYMVNMDSILAGTYRYVYSGKYNKETGEVENTWPIKQAMQLSDALGTGMRLNDTELNYDYPSPSTGSWSDHASFWSKMPYLYFEAANWELPDDPEHPEWGSSGAYETETGEVMHVPGRDDLSFIENTWGTRGKDTISAYCTLLDSILCQVSPDGLITPSKDALKEAIEKANDMDKASFSDSAYKAFQAALKEAKTVNKTEYILLKDQSVIDDATAKLNEAMGSVGSSISNATIEVEDQVYTGKSRRPEVVVKDGDKVLVEGTDYTVSYSNNKEIGTANVTAKGMNDYSGLAKATFSILPQEVTGLTASKKAATSIELSWDKVQNADGYKVYKYSTSSKKYVLIATIHDNDTTIYNNSKLVSATNYYYKVAAYKEVAGKNYVGAQSERLKATTNPLQPSVTLSTTTKKVKLTYDSKVSKRTDGYEIYMATSKNGTYKLIKDTDKTSYTKTSLTSKKGYYFKVRAYRTVDGQKVYSLYSLPKYIKVK